MAARERAGGAGPSNAAANQSRKYSVVEFDDGTVDAIPSKWVIKKDNGKCAYWPSNWSDAKIRKSIENCEPYTSEFTLKEKVRVIHTYNTILVARANATKSEFTSSLDTESEELGRHKRKRRARVISDLDDAVASVPHKKSSFPQPPTIAKSVVGNVKVKVGNSVRPSELPISSSSSANSQHILGKGKDCDGDGKAQNKALSSNENHSTVSVGKQHQKTGKEKKFCNNKDPVNNKKEASFSNSSYENPLNLVCAGSPHLKPGKDTTLSGAAVNNNRRETSQQNGALSLSTQEDEAEDDLSLHSGYEDSLYGDDLSSNIESPIQLCGKSHSSADLNEEQNKNKDETSKGLTKSANHKDETAKGTIKSANQTISKAEYVALLPLLAVINQRLATIERVQSSILRAVKPGQKLDLNVNNRFPLKNLDDFDSCEDYLSDKTNATEVTEFLSTSSDSSKDLKCQTYNMLKVVMSDELATEFNWKGSRGKMAFSKSKLQSVLKGALLDCNKESAGLVVPTAEEAIKNWLKYAEKRLSNQK